MLRLQRAWNRYYHSLRGLSASFDQPTRAGDDTESQDNSIENLYWRPDYLDWPVLAAFSTLFIVIAISCEVLLFYSNKNHGLATSYQGLHYLWTYGPTAILTLVASFWARVECQAKICAPWCRMLKGAATSQQSVSLDYISQFQPFAIYTAAVKNKDYPVAASASVSLLLRIVIVVSTSFIVLSPVDIRIENVNVTLKSEFINDSTGLVTTGPLAYSALAALMSDDVSLPEGISAEYAFVEAETNIQNVSELVVTVDAFEGGLHCEPATLTPVWGEISQNQSSTRHVWLKSENCEMAVSIDCNRLGSGDNDDTCTSLITWPKECSGSNPTYEKAVGIVASTLRNTPGSPINSTSVPDVFRTNIDVLRANSFICTPFYEISHIKTVRTNTAVKLLPAMDTTTRQLSSVSSWDIWGTYYFVFPSHTWYEEMSISLSGENINFDHPSWLGYQFSNYARSELLSNITSLFTGNNIVRLISSYYQQYIAILARVSLMKNALTPSIGSATVSQQRLLVQTVPTHIMTGLLLSSVMMVAITWRWQPRLHLSQNPTTAIGNAALLAHMPLRWSGIGFVSSSDLKVVLESWVYQIKQLNIERTQNHQLLIYADKNDSYKDANLEEMEVSTYKPFSLSVTYRSLAFILIFGMIATLEILLRKSEHNDGIADTPLDKRRYQLWTVIPGLLLALISMYTASIDADTRSQSPLLRLRQGVTFAGLNLDLIDRHTSTLIFEEVRSRCIESLASTLAVAITSLLTIFSASLFFATSLQAEVDVRLKPNSLIYDIGQWSHDPVGTRTDNIGVAILLENASYPAFTYQDLVFPGLFLDGPPLSHLSQSGIIYSTTIPAVRPDLTNCRLYDSTQIDISTETLQGSIIALTVVIHPEECSLSVNRYGYIDMTVHDHAYFGLKLEPDVLSCSSQIWTWGIWHNISSSNDTKSQFRPINALACDETLQIVETSVEFIAQTMVVNPFNPPIANYANVVSSQSHTYDFYGDLPYITNAENGTILDGFFTIMTSSRYAIPVSYLGDPTKISAVIESIQFHHRIFVVQFLNQNCRYDSRRAAEESHDPDIRPVWDTPTSFNATARDPSGRNRVVQDVVSTRVLQALLSATLVCLSVNWFLMRNIDVVPRSPTSIGNWMALLADGNFGDYLPPNAGQMPLDQISRWYFGQDAVFRLGFRKSPETGKEVLGIYVVSQHSAYKEREEPPVSTE